jgi:hypothetical protein
LDMYAAPKMVTYGGATVAGRAATHGIPAGCPLATEWQRLRTWPWIERLRRLPSNPYVRGWVDDLTVCVWSEAEVTLGKWSRKRLRGLWLLKLWQVM